MQLELSHGHGLQKNILHFFRLFWQKYYLFWNIEILKFINYHIVTINYTKLVLPIKILIDISNWYHWKTSFSRWIQNFFNLIQIFKNFFDLLETSKVQISKNGVHAVNACTNFCWRMFDFCCTRAVFLWQKNTIFFWEFSFFGIWLEI